MAIGRRILPAIDGSYVTLGDGTSRERHIYIESGTYDVPFWLRWDDEDAASAVQVTALPYAVQRTARQVAVRNKQPASINISSANVGTRSTFVVPDIQGGQVGAVADPEQLPIATGQLEDLNQYINVLNVPGMSAGQSYADPVTGVTVYKITDGNFFADKQGGASRWGKPPYAEGGPYISCPWTHPTTGRTMYTLMFQIWTTCGLYDFDYDAGTFENWRDAPWGEILGSFSFNTATPRIAYYTNGSQVIRYDTASMSIANTGNFPGPFIGNEWFHQDGTDTWFVSMDGSNNIRTWNSQTNELQSWGSAGDEPHIDRSGNYVYGVGNPQTWSQGNLNTGPPWQGNFRDWVADWSCSHGAGAFNGYLMGSDPDVGGGSRLEYWDPTTQSRTYLGDAGEGCWGHGAAQWVHDNATDLSAWCCSSSYTASACANLADAIGFYRFNDVTMDEPRLLCHHYSTAAVYGRQPHATISPDGKLVFFGSDMNGQSRVDGFLAIVPTA